MLLPSFYLSHMLSHMGLVQFFTFFIECKLLLITSVIYVFLFSKEQQLKMSLPLLFSIFSSIFLNFVNSATITLEIYYPESGLDFTAIDSFGGSVFTLNVYSTCMENHLDSKGDFTFGTDVCPVFYQVYLIIPLLLSSLSSISK